MSRNKLLNLLPVIVLVVLAFASIYTVNEGQQALLLRFGKLSINPTTHKPYVIGAGLHVKIPFVQQVKLFDTRLQTLDIKASRIMTAEKKDVIVDYYAKWKISDLALYLKSTGGDDFQAEALLGQNLNSILRAEFGKRSITEVITEVISDQRDEIMSILKNNILTSANELGMQVVDVRIKDIDLPASASHSVYEKMRAQMQKNANKHRADGNAQAEVIKASADAQVTVILAQAKSMAEIIKAKGKATAAQIYTDAYSKEPQFYAFYRSLQAYQQVFNNKQDILVLRPDSKFFEYFKQNEK